LGAAASQSVRPSCCRDLFSIHRRLDKLEVNCQNPR
jgi:hypothetical protein